MIVTEVRISIHTFFAVVVAVFRLSDKVDVVSCGIWRFYGCVRRHRDGHFYEFVVKTINVYLVRMNDVMVKMYTMGQSKSLDQTNLYNVCVCVCI